MAERVPATGLTRSIPLQQRRQTKKPSPSSSSSRSSSADHQSGPSGKSQTQSTHEAAPGPTHPSKGKAPQRSSSSQSMSMDPYSRSSRSNSMGQQGAVVDPAEEITYTPTTHRISKAKKGKKVHVCEHGCGKVFTRAEHRKYVNLSSINLVLLRTER
ncbi:hypothetical protein MMC30_001841 [Trapelia coarctata]|nr:hypothetical protein [Trapelia coarctata]